MFLIFIFFSKLTLEIRLIKKQGFFYDGLAVLFDGAARPFFESCRLEANMKNCTAKPPASRSQVPQNLSALKSGLSSFAWRDREKERRGGPQR